MIGTGIAGLGCAWNLRDAAHVTLFEKAGRPGGHTNTVDVDEFGETVSIDTGFIVFNHATYPNLCRLFAELDVPTQPGEMSFSVQHLPDRLEYNGMGFAKVFAQKRNLFRPRYHRFLRDVLRFFKVGRRAIETGLDDTETVEEFVGRNRFGRDFLEYYLVPMSAAIWSSPPGGILKFPAALLIRFFENHGFLGVDSHHQWYTVTGGARKYVRRILERIADLRAGDPIVGVETADAQVAVQTSTGARENFDRVIIAAHADESLQMLRRPSTEQARLLEPFRYQQNHATLHTDDSWMPRRRIAWASWNYRVEADPAGGARETTHYWMNALQRVSKKRNYFVSLNCEGRIPREYVLYETVYEHPQFTVDALHAQRELPMLNRAGRDQRIFFCGSYFRNGFHEDAYWSALQACADLRGRWQ